MMPKFLRRFLVHWSCWMTGWLVISLALWAATGSMVWAGASISAGIVLALVAAALLLDRVNPGGW